ncbi:MAG: hypothetical protein ACAH07_05930 [Methylophilaceae bacterium]|nr:hypothetical protein [Methyloradius sp.]
MNDELLKQIHAEMLESTSVAIGILASAVARQLDPVKLQEDLKEQIAIVGRMPDSPSMATKLATHALAAVSVEVQLQKQTKH